MKRKIVRAYSFPGGELRAVATDTGTTFGVHSTDGRRPIASWAVRSDAFPEFAAGMATALRDFAPTPARYAGEQAGAAALPVPSDHMRTPDQLHDTERTTHGNRR